MPITILMTTYAPAGGIGEATAAAAHYSIKQWRKRLQYDGDLRLHVADDGSSLPGYGLSVDSPPASYWGKRGPVTFSRQERHGIGASLNAGLTEAFRHSPVAAFFMDDWGLKWPFELGPWANLLLKREDIGLVRLGPPHPNTGGCIELFEEAWYLRLTTDGIFTGLRPWMIHERMMQTYGPFAEDVHAATCEQLWNELIRETPGPDVVLALPTAWEWVYAMDGHQHRPSLASIDPREEKSFVTYRCANGHVFDWPHEAVLDGCQWITDRSLEFTASLCGAAVERVE